MRIAADSGCFKGVRDVEHVARVDVEPPHRTERVVTPHHAEPGAVLVAPPVGHVALTLDRDVEIENDRQVHEDDVLGGQREVVHHGVRLDIQRPVDRQLAVGVGTVIRDVRLEDAAVSEEVQLAGRRADLRMRGHRIDQLAAEVVGAQRLQVVGDLVGQRRLDQRQRLAGVVDDVGVGDAGPQVAGAIGVVEREVLLEAVGAHPAVAIPGGAAALDADAVDHAVAGEPVCGRLSRVGPVAQVPAVEFGRDGALDGQVELGQLIGHGRVVVSLKELAGAEQGGGGIGHSV